MRSRFEPVKGLDVSPSLNSSQSSLLWRMLGFLRPVSGTALLASVVVAARVGTEAASVAFLSPPVSALARLAPSTGGAGFVAWLAGAGPGAAGLRATFVAWTLSQLALALLV